MTPGAKQHRVVRKLRSQFMIHNSRAPTMQEVAPLLEDRVKTKQIVGKDQGDAEVGKARVQLDFIYSRYKEKCLFCRSLICVSVGMIMFNLQDLHDTDVFY